MQKAMVSREYSAFYAGSTNTLIHDYAIFDSAFEVIQAVQDGYKLQDCDGYIHPFVPAEFVTFVD